MTSKLKSKTLTKSKERIRDLGEVFTPDFLVDRMLDNLPEAAWGKNKKWLEPTCGNGQFILGIIRHKMAKGQSLIWALDTTFGMDIMKDNIAECHHRIYTDIVMPYFQDKFPNDCGSDGYQAPLHIRGFMWSNKIAGKVWKAVCIVENNIVHTKNSLDESWNNRWCHFNDLPDTEKNEKIVAVKAALAMIDGSIEVDKQNALYKRLAKSFRTK